MSIERTPRGTEIQPLSVIEAASLARPPFSARLPAPTPATRQRLAPTADS